MDATVLGGGQVILAFSLILAAIVVSSVVLCVEIVQGRIKEDG